jgi:hypothetical protein
MSWNLEIYRRTSQKTNKKMPLDERLLCAYAYACAEVFLSFGIPFANVVSALLMCTTLSDLFVSLGDVGSVPSVSNLSFSPFRSTGVASISIALSDALGALVSMLLPRSPLLQPDGRRVGTGMFITFVISLGFVLLDVRMGGEGLVFIDDEMVGGFGLSFGGVVVPFTCSITPLAT